MVGMKKPKSKKTTKKASNSESSEFDSELKRNDESKVKRQILMNEPHFEQFLLFN